MRKYHTGQRIMYRFNGVTFTGIIDVVSTNGEYVKTTLSHTVKVENIVSIVEQAQAPASQTTEYKVGQEIMYTYQGRHYADVIDHISITRTWVSTEYNGHFVDIENIITPGTAPMRSITPVARPKTAEQLIIQPRTPIAPDLRTSYEESLTSMVNVYEMNRLHESISAMHKEHAIDIALDTGNAELFNALTEGASSI